jgi:hypothetical protein
MSTPGTRTDGELDALSTSVHGDDRDRAEPVVAVSGALRAAGDSADRPCPDPAPAD